MFHSFALTTEIPAHRSESDPGLYERKSQIIKRAVDVLVSILALTITLPITLLAAAAIKITSDGPVIFRQHRLGHGGRPFTLLKFRTMRVGADSKVHKAFVQRLITKKRDAEDGARKLTNDDRITRVGRFLRRTCLDELPQLINVLNGDMSLVGPRPCLPYEFECYKEWHRERLKAIPGLTGLWQISDRNKIDFDDMVFLDLLYLRKWSLWLDLKILVHTPLAVFKGSGCA